MIDLAYTTTMKNSAKTTLTTIQSYKQRPQLLEGYDAIVIGSGMGGLTTAALLAKQGKKVLVLERHYTPGGFTHIFKRKGYEWDVGIHYIGEMQRKNSLLRKIFGHITDGNLQWADMGRVYDRIVIGDQAYDFVKGVAQFKQQLITYFPEEEKAVHAYVDLVFKAVKTSKNYYMSKAMPPYLEALMGGFMRRPLYRYSDRTTYAVLRSLTDNERLIKVLTGQYGDYGLPPKKSSFYMHASLARHYFDGGNFPVGGSSKVVETIAPIISAAGGTILVSAQVDKVLVENNRAVGVQMADGRTLKAKQVASNAGIVTTYTQLLPEETVKKHGLHQQLKKIKPSAAHLCLYVGLKGSPEALELPKTNYWIYPEDGDHDSCVARYLQDQEAPFPVVYLSFPSAKDPDWPRRYPGKSTIDIITLVPFETFGAWQDKPWKKRGAAYEAKKERFAQRLLEVLYQQLPHLRDKVDYYELSTPLTTRHFVNYGRGEIYGLDHDPKRFRQSFLKPRTPIKNFYLTGQDIATAGIGGALFSGVLTATAMSGKNILREVLFP
ncbi:phytoene desaturase family protein [Maribacter sp. 2307ULW6-5]|uniref:phytoene desaturase family protein n=1 Tax=Maribacter sp. 2307ULW6-5 TaxID=3386275 RepID=UPI0039BD688F